MMHRTVSHMFVISIVANEYLLGLSRSSIISLMIRIIAEKGKNEQNNTTAAKIIVDVELF